MRDITALAGDLPEVEQGQRLGIFITGAIGHGVTFSEVRGRLVFLPTGQRDRTELGERLADVHLVARPLRQPQRLASHCSRTLMPP
jgi:hypothetical protein